MNILLIFNRHPYDGTDVSWNGLRLAGKLMDNHQRVRIFLMNDAVDMARSACLPPEDYDQDLSAQLKTLIDQGAAVKVCGTCMSRCGIYKNQPYLADIWQSNMQELAEWLIDSDKVISF